MQMHTHAIYYTGLINLTVGKLQLLLAAARLHTAAAARWLTW
jgi:hypothetical protein